MIENNVSIAKSSVNYVINGMSLSGYRFGLEKESGYQFPTDHSSNVIRWCQNANINLKQSDINLIELWITGDFANRKK